MGRRQYLTIRKRRCNERGVLKGRQQDKASRARLIKRVYGGPGSIDDLYSASNKQIDKNRVRYRVSTEIGNDRVSTEIGDDRVSEIGDDRVSEIGDDTVSTEIGDGRVAEIGDDRMSEIGDDRVSTEIGDDRVAEIGNDREQIGNNRVVEIADDREGQIDDPRGQVDDDEMNWNTSLIMGEIPNESFADSLLHEPYEYSDWEDEAANVDQLHDKVITFPEPLNWTFSYDMPAVSDISISKVGMDTEQACLLAPSGSAFLDLWQPLQHSDILNAGWFALPSNQNDGFQLCKSGTNAAGSPMINYTVEILLDRHWILRIPQGVINWQNHPVLKELPIFVHSLSDLKRIAEVITLSKRFPGINDPKFDVIVRKHKGRFYDNSGMHYNIDVCHCIQHYVLGFFMFVLLFSFYYF